MTPRSGRAPRTTFLIPDLRGGGAERVAVDLAGSVSGTEIDVLLFGEAQELEAGVPVTSLASPIGTTHGGRARRVYELLRAGAKLRRWRKQHAREAWVSFLTWPNVLNALTRRSGERIVLTVHNDLQANLGGSSAPVTTSLVRRAYRRADAVIAVSDQIRRDLVSRIGLPPDKVVTIHNPVDLERVRRLSLEPIPPKSEWVFQRPVLVSVGSLTVQKGHRHLIRIAAELRRRGTPFRILILGTGPLRNELSELATAGGLKVASLEDGEAGPLGAEALGPETPGTEALGAEARGMEAADIVFMGFVRNPFPWMARATLHVMSSLWEGFGLVLVEAMQCGTPVVAPDCRSGPREILAPSSDPEGTTLEPWTADYGVLMPPFQLPALSSSTSALSPTEQMWVAELQRLLNDPDRLQQLAQAGPERAQDFALEKQASQWAAVIRGDSY